MSAEPGGRSTQHTTPILKDVGLGADGRRPELLIKQESEDSEVRNRSGLSGVGRRWSRVPSQREIPSVRRTMVRARGHQNLYDLNPTPRPKHSSAQNEGFTVAHLLLRRTSVSLLKAEFLRMTHASRLHARRG